jgi:PDDEXK-like domain of unknown function (DUF3799)
VRRGRRVITSAKLVAVDYDDVKYHAESGKRGTKKYVMSRSGLCEFAKCPARWRDGYERKDSDATDYGSLIDCLFLTPKRFDDRFAVKPNTYQDAKTGEIKPWHAGAGPCKAWIEEIGARTPISTTDSDEAAKAIERLQKDKTIFAYAQSSAKQVYCTAKWKDPCGITVPIKILIDLVPDKTHKDFGNTLGDFKTARDAALRPWAKAVHDYHYDMQAAMNLDVFNAATGQQRNDFRHIIQENVPPYQTAKRYLSREFIIGGRARYQDALERYAQCLKDNVWPDYDFMADVHYQGWAEIGQEPWMVKGQPIERPAQTTDHVEDYRH